MTKTQEAALSTKSKVLRLYSMLRLQVDNLSLEVERQNEQIGVLIDAANIMKDKIKNLETTADLNHTTIMELQSQNLQLTAVVQNHARFLKAGEDDYDLLAAENKENLRGYIRSTIKSDAYISAGTFSLDGLD